MFRINTNTLAINGQRNLFRTANDLSKRMERLTSGLRINRASDDAAGLTVSELMRSQIAGSKQANQNISQALTLLQVADGGLEQVGGMLRRLKELAIQSADGTLNATNRSGISLEAAALIAEIDRIAETTTFNGVSLISSAGSGSTNFTFYLGDGSASIASANQQAGVNIKGINFLADGTGSIGDNLVALTVADFLSQTSAAALVSVADTAVNSVAQIRTELGAFSNRLSRSQINIQTIMENTANAESIVRDADFAAEASAMTRAQILTQSGISMLSQANLIPQQALSLLQF
ncbi:flagellin FliC [Candidatus Poribacteria bacterium]|jgi:flagellin|nr:flagellin FliC [Candidatus Poribacteria bacterium]MBT5531459.1 flagellin FliC [Candidatus Poribacteria bacterium]MBT7101086.1 flagellin FliC [Candidatus Poribacteria bacterium]MBT7804772.1 flagellin FliC [Candidatus Poribacteria bacterium]